MDKVLNILKNNKIVQGALVFGGVAASAYLLYTGIKEVKSEEQQKSLEQRIQEIIQNAQIHDYQGHKYYDLQTLMDFTDIFAELAIPEFKEFALKYREERRKLMDIDREKYFDSIIEYNNKMLLLVGQQSEKLFTYEGYNDEYMRVAISLFMREPEYQQKIVFSLARVKSSIASPDSNLTKEDAQSIIAFYITYLKSQPEIMVHFVKYLKAKNPSQGQQGQIFTALKTAMYDQLYLQKGYEEEDFLIPGMSEEYLSDPITQRVQKQYSDTVVQFIEYHSS